MSLAIYLYTLVIFVWNVNIIFMSCIIFIFFINMQIYFKIKCITFDLKKEREKFQFHR